MQDLYDSWTVASIAISLDHVPCFVGICALSSKVDVQYYIHYDSIDIKSPVSNVKAIVGIISVSLKAVRLYM